MIKIDSIKISAKSNINIKEYVFKQFGLKKDISDFVILKKSLDARDKNDIRFVYSVALKTDEKEEKYLLRKYKNISEYSSKPYKVSLKKHDDSDIVIVGMGPAGLFAALILSEAGYKPVIIDKGKCVEDRIKDVESFFEGGKLDINSNVQFGEGGAGTFSDGKLNTGIKDPEGRKEFVLKTFVKYGADENILYDSKPHIGTDVLRTVIKNLREDLINKGVKFLFSTEFVSFIENNGKLKEINLKDVYSGEEKVLPCDKLILAIGHSSRNTFEYLSDKLSMETKPFAMGFRVIHEQSFIDRAQYGYDFENLYENLEPSPYKLTHQGKRGVYSFCMCPGGYVVNASSEENRLCVNGMSEFKRDSGYANSAIIVQINKDDLDDTDILSGMKLQREIEEKAFNTGKGSIPVSDLNTFFDDLKFENNIEFKDCTINLDRAIKGSYEYADITDIYPEFLNQAFCEAMLDYDNIIKGFASVNPLLAGTETRSSSPVKILRNENFESSIKGIYPCGEGAGYAGGIVSAAIDGMKVAEALILK
ncbi:MAG: FAD-dependent oxidoreductase [Lachnospiraceae bacterium]|nr:FAD-dependent oxidoreductase [Lachnospiraceae bacterium]